MRPQIQISLMWICLFVERYGGNLYREYKRKGMQKELPVRKHPRLKDYDYNSNGAYFITFCTKDGHGMLGEVVGRGILDAPCITQSSEYGVNLCNTIDFVNQTFNDIIIDKYAVMPNHVHMIVLVVKNDIVAGEGSGASGKPRPTNALIPKLLSSVKRHTNKLAGFNMWQTSFYDEIIRNEQAYHNICKYIDENPAKWAEDKYYNLQEKKL